MITDVECYMSNVDDVYDSNTVTLYRFSFVFCHSFDLTVYVSFSF